jgi:hypothetical protein
VLAAFVGTGLKEGAKILCLEDQETPSAVRRWLAESGVDLGGHEEALLTGCADEAYCSGGRLVPDELLEAFSASCLHAVTDGYSGLRIAGDMGWVLRRGIDRGLLLEYETKATSYAAAIPCVAVCEYDARKFDGETIMDVLSVHPAMLVRGQIVHNRYYVHRSPGARRG